MYAHLYCKAAKNRELTRAHFKFEIQECIESKKCLHLKNEMFFNH
uniref:Uncharacterized protein n=1 Tax=Anguilla anguilla TaxID=7936 RepID=A0A0E9TZ74_ANGAN